MANTLKYLVAKYGKTKAEADSYKKPLEEMNTEIKSLMQDTGISEYESGGYKAKMSVATTDDFDEAKLIRTLMDIVDVDTYKKVVKMKEYVDMEALEDAIYNGKISAANLSDCKVSKQTVRLTITKLKEK
jgi:hypothetical protein